MKTGILISGFGGQGLISLGKILARAAAAEGKYTVFFPSYGAQMRGGTAHCFVKIANLPIASPFVDNPEIAIIFNQPSLNKFKKQFKKSSLVILNSDLISKTKLPKDLKIVSLSLNKLALKCGNIRTANIVALGILSKLKPELIKRKTLVSVLNEIFRTKDSLKANLKAFSLGEKFITSRSRSLKGDEK